MADQTWNTQDSGQQFTNLQLVTLAIYRAKPQLLFVCVITQGNSPFCRCFTQMIVPTKSGDANVNSEKPVFGHRSLSEQLQFDYSMWRHSIAVGQDPHMLQGIKRKMLADWTNFAAVGGEIDPQLAGPSIPSMMDIDPDTQASKWCGSAVDTQRIAQLSLNDHHKHWT